MGVNCSVESSRKLSGRAAWYRTVEKECLATQWAVESLCFYLLGRPRGRLGWMAHWSRWERMKFILLTAVLYTQKLRSEVSVTD